MATRRRSAKSSKSKKPERVGLGGGSVDKHLNRPKKRRNERWARVGDGNTITVRVVDTKEFFVDGDVHPVEFERKDGSSYDMDIRCLDVEGDGDPCPGCRDDLEVRYKFWMLVIVRDAEKVNKSGKVIGEEDQLRILSGANRLVKALNAKQKRRDLTKRDIEISQEGEGFDVQYEVEWADDEDKPLSKADKKLIEEGDDIIDAFKLYTELRDEDTFYDPPRSDDDDDDDPGEKSKRRGSVFGERKKKGTSKRSRDEDDDDDDDDDEDDEDERPARRRSSAKSKKTKAKPKGILAAKKKTGKKPGIKTRRK